MIYTDNTFYTVRYSAPLRLVEIVWHGLISTEEFKDSLLLVLQVIKENSACYALADAKGLATNKSSEQTWFQSDFMLALNELKLQRLARVIDPDTFGQAVTSNQIDYTQQGSSLFDYEVQCFHERSNAIEWLCDEIAV